MNNPFITNGYVSAAYFCDREEETKALISLLTNGNNVALISPRRMGKTALLHHCFAQKEISEQYHTFLIDIYSTHSLADFVNVFGQAIVSELRSKGRHVWQRFINILSSLKSEITFDINGMPVWSISIGAIKNPVATLYEIFQYLKEADKPSLIAIDEFQQILKYDNSESVEAILRTHIQQCTNANFVFSGSHRHMMETIFTSPSRPFYQSITLFNLRPIALEKYVEFCTRHFNNANKALHTEVVAQIYEQFNKTTSYMQRIMNILYKETASGGTCGTEKINEAINFILAISNDTYESLLYQLPEMQRNTLIAIAKDGEARAVCSAAFVQRHRLPSASSVSSAIKGLLDRDLITHNTDHYSLCDIFFRIWLNNKLQLNK